MMLRAISLGSGNGLQTVWRRAGWERVTVIFDAYHEAALATHQLLMGRTGLMERLPKFAHLQMVSSDGGDFSK